MSRLPNMAVVALLLLSVLTGADTPDAAVTKVRDGIQKFRNSEFSEAEKSFSEASEIAPQNATILFDEACAALAAKDTDQARDLFRKAALAEHSAVSVKVHYNLGCLEADAAREKLGDDPAGATGDVREESIQLMLTAVRHYRDTLALDAQHTDARHNLELIRLYIKHIQSQWEERDKQKDREEKSLLQFLKMIEDRQTQLRTSTKSVADEPDSVRKRQAVRETAAAQRTLHEEIEPLKQKIDAELQATQQQPAGGTQSAGPGHQGNLLQPGTAAQSPPPDDQMEQMRTLLHQLSDEAGRNMLKAAESLDVNDSTVAIANETESLMLLHQLYLALAPYPDILQRAIERQQTLLGEHAEHAEVAEAKEPAADEPEEPPATVSTEGASEQNDGAENSDKGTGDDAVDTSSDAPLAATDFEEIGEGQSRITDFSRMLALKAEAELPQVQQQLEALRQAAPETATPDGPPTDADEDDADEDDADENDPDENDPEKDKRELSEEEVAAEAQRQQLQQQLKQVEGLAKSMELAVQLAPEAEQHSQAAGDQLAQQQEAVSEQQETHRILKQIAEPLVDQEQPDQDDQNQDNDDQNQDNDDQDQQQNEDGDQGEQNQEQQEDEQQEKDEQQDDSEEQDAQSKQDKAESVLRQAREREQQHKDLQKQLRAILGQRIKVDRDW
ncbi:MAG: hypothetical protein GY903_19210 [Fuerstiella sp.]|nr:hypothetical protein [Fuerstiella sp.]MCP4856614.1 hypothetical protein [Fuerstiella sp.]